MTIAVGWSLAARGSCHRSRSRWWIAQYPPSVLSRVFVVDIRNVPTIPPGRPWGTENAKNTGPDPSSGPTPSRHLLSFPTRPAIPRKASAPTT